MAPAVGGELALPAAPTLVEAAEAIQGLVTLKDFLDEAEVARVEAVLARCAREADFQVNEREYGQGKSPSDIECDRVVRQTKDGEKVTRAMELGTLKHNMAFACIERELGREFADHVTREPRYGKQPPGDRYGLTDEGAGSLVPDVVLHMGGNANAVQFLYDFLFPCTSSSKSNPLGRNGVKLQRKLEKYDALAEKPRRALVTPQLGISR